MEADDDGSENKLGTLFRDVRYYVVGNILQSVDNVLISGGGRKDNYLSEMITHVIADDGAEDEVTEAKELFRLPVVTSSWILMSSHCRCLLPTCIFDPDPMKMIFHGLTMCPSKLSASDSRLIWVLVTIHGGKFQRVLDKRVTHLVTAEAHGAKYQSVCEASSVHIVTPDWIIHCAEAMSRIDEIRYHPRLLLDMSQEFVHESKSAVSVVQSLSNSNCVLDNTVPSSSGVALDSSQTARPIVSVVPISTVPTTVISHEHVRTRLKRISNENEYLTEVCQNQLKSVGSTKPMSVTSVTRCLGVSYCEPLVAAGCSSSLTNKLFWMSESNIYYGHDPCEHVPEDVCLLGCIFYIADYQKYLEHTTLDVWRQVICHYGGQVDDSYSNRITHVLCEHQKSDVFQLALRDGKRLITAYWLNDCLLSRRMSVPRLALHFPYVFGKERPGSSQIICVTNFEGRERQKVKQMIMLIGAKYTGYMTRANSLLIAKHVSGDKCEKAHQWNIPVVSIKWLTDIVLGDTSVLKLPVNSCYTTVTGDESFTVDVNKVFHLLEGWKTPVKISKEMWKKFQSSSLLQNSRLPVAIASGSDKHNSGPSAQKVARLLDQNEKMPVVLFTGFNKYTTSLLSKEVIRLGGRVVHSAVMETTHLVTNAVLRTVKFLTALAVVRYIVTSEWIEQSRMADHFLAENQFELIDEKAEKIFDFHLKESLCRAHKNRLFKDLVFYFTPGVRPSKSVLVSIVAANGGHVVDSLHQLNSETKATFVVVSCEEDMYLCTDISKTISIHNAEFVLTGIFRQEIDFHSYRIK